LLQKSSKGDQLRGGHGLSFHAIELPALPRLVPLV
jgi:hypothetical protein